jgi:cell division protein FtsZ
VAVVSKPFSFEGRKRLNQAEDGLETIREVADTVITIPNDRLRGLASKNATMIDMFRKADEVLLHSVKGITDLILMPGLVNLDFADVKTTMEKAGMAIMGIGIASGENRAIEAAERAISHPLLEDLSISGAKGVLMNITSTSDLTMEEMTEASERIYSEVGEDAEIIWGTVVDENLGDEMRVTVIATGIGGDRPGVISGRRRSPRNFQSARSVSRPAPRREDAGRRPHPAANDRGYPDYSHAVDYEEPAFLRQKKTADENVQSAEYPEFDDKHLDVEDLDIPTFLRRKAD